MVIIVSLTIKELSLYHLPLNPALHSQSCVLAVLRAQDTSSKGAHCRRRDHTLSLFLHHFLSSVLSSLRIKNPICYRRRHYNSNKAEFQNETRKCYWVIFLKGNGFVCYSLFLFQCEKKRKCQVGLDFIQWDFIGPWKVGVPRQNGAWMWICSGCKLRSLEEPFLTVTWRLKVKFTLESFLMYPTIQTYLYYLLLLA